MLEEILKKLGVGKPAPNTGSLCNGDDVSTFLRVPQSVPPSAPADVYLDAPVTLTQFSKVSYTTALYVIPFYGHYAFEPIDSTIFDN